MLARTARLGRRTKLVYAYVGAHPVLISAAIIAVTVLDLWFAFHIRPLDVFRSPLLTGLAITSVAGLTFLYVMRMRPERAWIGLFVAVGLFFIAPGVGVFLVLETRPPLVTVSLPSGASVCDPSAELLWKGQRTLVLRCGDNIVFVEEPHNIIIRPAP
jgi:hypothetical protein